MERRQGDTKRPRGRYTNSGAGGRRPAAAQNQEWERRGGRAKPGAREAAGRDPEGAKPEGRQRETRQKGRQANKDDGRTEKTGAQKRRHDGVEPPTPGYLQIWQIYRRPALYL
eukprot:scaffold260591_cov44-Tisochrysis_lutea.AAC.1